jgi:hypothetical protein
MPVYDDRGSTLSMQCCHRRLRAGKPPSFLPDLINLQTMLRRLDYASLRSGKLIVKTHPLPGLS